MGHGLVFPLCPLSMQHLDTAVVHRVKPKWMRLYRCGPAAQPLPTQLRLARCTQLCVQVFITQAWYVLTVSFHRRDRGARPCT